MNYYYNKRENGFLLYFLRDPVLFSFVYENTKSRMEGLLQTKMSEDRKKKIE